MTESNSIIHNKMNSLPRAYFLDKVFLCNLNLPKPVSSSQATLKPQSISLTMTPPNGDEKFACAFDTSV